MEAPILDDGDVWQKHATKRKHATWILLWAREIGKYSHVPLFAIFALTRLMATYPLESISHSLRPTHQLLEVRLGHKVSFDHCDPILAGEVLDDTHLRLREVRLRKRAQRCGLLPADF